MTHAIRLLLLLVTTLIALALVTVFVIAGRPDGFRWIATKAPEYVPGELVIDEPGGDLFNGITAARVVYRTDDLEVIAYEPAAKIGLVALTTGLLRFNELSIRQLDITATGPAKQTAAPPEIALPLSVEIRQGSVGQVNWVSATQSETIENIVFSGAMRDSRLRAETLQLSIRDVVLDLRGAVRFSGDWPLRTSLSWSLEQNPEVSGSGTAEGSLKQLALQQALQVPDALILDAEIRDIWSAPNFLAEVSTPEDQQIQIDEIMLQNIQAQISGTLESYVVKARSTVSTPQFPDTIRIAATGSGDLEVLRIDSLTAETLEGLISLSGILKLDDLQFSADADARQLNLTVFDLRLPAATSAKVRLEGQLPSLIAAEFETLTGTAEVTSISLPVSGRGGLVWQSAALTAQNFKLESGANSAQVDGLVWPGLDASFSLNLNTPGVIVPETSGTLRASGRIGGSMAAPELKVSGSGEQLFWQDRSLDSVSVEASVTESGRLNVSASAQNLRAGDERIETIALGLDGLLQGFDVEAALTRNEDSFKLAGTGSYSPERISLDVGQASLETRQAGTWLLADAFSIAAAPETGSVEFTAHCWRSEQTSLCADSGSIGSSLSLAGRIDNLPAARVPGSNTLGAAIAGTIDANFEISGSATNPRAEGRIGLTGLEVSAADPDDPEETLTFRLDSGEAIVTLFDQSLALTALAQGNGTTALSIDGSTGWPLSNNTPVQGSLQARIASLSNLEPLLYRYTGVTNPAGELNAKIDIAGTFGAPVISGIARISDAAISVPQAGIDIGAIDIALTGNGAEPLTLVASAESGGGQIRLNGEVDWRGDTPRATARLSGERFQILRFPTQEALASPDLNLEITPQLISIDGRVEIPQADISVAELPKTAIRPSEDAVVKRQTVARPKRNKGPAVALNLLLTLGNEVRLNAFGLDTDLRGNLRLTRTAADTRLLADGNLRSVDGKFEAYNRELIIDRGTLVFSGSIEQPLVDVRAVREVTYAGQMVTVGVLLSGPIDNMRTRVFGEPAMSESDALSYLVMNRPLQRNESLDNSELSEAAVALGLTTLLPVTEGVTSALGIDEVSIDSTTDGDTAVVAGKRLSDEFYIRYAYGLFDKIGTFVVRYEIGRGFSLEAGSGEEQTLDLLYSIDR